MSLKCLHAFINLICIVRTSFEETFFFRDEKISLSRSCYRLEIIVLYHILFKIRLLNLFLQMLIQLFSFTCLGTRNMYIKNQLSLSQNIYNMIYNCPMQSYLATEFESLTLISIRLVTRSIQTIFKNESCKNFSTFHKSCKNFSFFHKS